ncbi:hypothetical protein RA8CHR_05224 [Variovorax sp. RA8]|nr:hypothetical protein RA8CHR_05224 [Variovorax sp. RA8]
MEAAAKGELVIRDPQTTLPYRPERVREFWEILTPADVNAWLQAQGAPYRWNVLTDLEAQDAFAKFDPLQARYDDERSNQKYAVAWWNSALKASMWWELKSIKPREAAMLLCGLNPHGREATGEALAPEGEPSADDYKTLLRYFDDEAQDAQARTLQQWLDFATRKGLSHHSWIDEWLEAMPTARASSGASATEPAGRAGSAVWTKERKEEARAMLERLQGQGLKNYAATTAKAFGVSGSRLREVLKDKKEKGTPKKLNNSAFTWRRSSTKER